MGVYFWQDVPYRTFTISWTEKSDMSSWWTYSDDAAWLTAWSTEFDEFFWYSWVRLSTAWVETAEVTQTQSWWAWKLDITQLWTLTSWDNVMIKFPLRWIKMTKSWSVVTLSITDNPNAEWYQYYAHSIWTLSNPWTPNDVFYLWTYKWHDNNNNWIIFSRSWVWPSVSRTQSTFCTQAKANGSWYNIIGFYQRQFINALYMMKYWNPDGQSVIWKWYTWWSAKTNTWGTNSQTDATYWTSSNTTQMKLFWLEDRWGNVGENVWGIYSDWDAKIYAMLTWWVWGFSWGEYTWLSTGTVDGRNLSAIGWTNKSMFCRKTTVTNTSYNTYYCDYVYVGANNIAVAGWAYNNNLGAWPFDFRISYVDTSSNTGIWTRLMYMNWLT